MRIKNIIFMGVCLLSLAVSSVLAESDTYQADKALMIDKCTECHPIDTYYWPRSFKSWQLTIENMRAYTFEWNDFSDEEGERIARFLADYVGDGKLLAPIEPESPTEEVRVDNIVAASLVSKVKLPTAPEIKLPIMKQIWNPSRAALFGARVSGFFALFFLLSLIASGFKRKSLKVNFRRVHVSMALGLFLSLSIHGVIYIFEYGTPAVIWYWFGLIGFAALIITQVQGIVRKHFRKGLLTAHIVGGCTGLLLSILHWVWAWI